MARTHHRGVIRKRLMPITFVSESGEGKGLVFQSIEESKRTSEKVPFKRLEITAFFSP